MSTTPTNYVVSVRQLEPRRIATVAARLPVPALFRHYLDQVYAAARANALRLDGQNIFVYRPVPYEFGEVDVEFGVGVVMEFSPLGPVHCVNLPQGQVAMTTHKGAYSGLGYAHAAVVRWCRAQGLTMAGLRWEAYGHWTNDEAQLRTDVCYLLESL